MLSEDNLITIFYLNDIEDLDVYRDSSRTIVIYNKESGEFIYRLSTVDYSYEEFFIDNRVRDILSRYKYDYCKRTGTSEYNLDNECDLLAIYDTMIHDTIPFPGSYVNEEEELLKKFRRQMESFSDGFRYIYCEEEEVFEEAEDDDDEDDEYDYEMDDDDKDV